MLMDKHEHLLRVIGSENLPSHPGDLIKLYDTC